MKLRVKKQKGVPPDPPITRIKISKIANSDPLPSNDFFLQNRTLLEGKHNPLPANFKDKPIDQILVPDIGIQKKFYETYIGSPKYIERLKKQGYKNPESTVADRLNALKKINVHYMKENGREGSNYQPSISNAVGSSKYNLDKADMYVSEKQILNPWGQVSLPQESIKAHELSHAAGSTNAPSSYGLNNNEKNELNNRNRYNKVSIKKILEPYQKETEMAKRNYNEYLNKYGLSDERTRAAERDVFKKELKTNSVENNIAHDKDPTELKADIDTFRYYLKKANIYDASTQDFNKDHLKKFREAKLPNKENNELFERLFRRLSDDDLIHLMNRVAKKTTNQNNTA